MRPLPGLLLLLCTFAAAVPVLADASGNPPDPGVTVLLYHRFGDSRYPTTNVSTDLLVRQLEYLRDNEYRVLHPREFEAIMEGKRPAGPRDVLLTVDDGYRSFAEQGFPVFRRFGFPVAVFLSTESIERGYSDMLTWEDVARLQDEGVRFANHSHGHPHSGTRLPGETPEGYEHRLREDTVRAREILRSHGIDNDWYAYPYGEWTSEFTRVLQDLGYRWLFSQDPGTAPAGQALPVPIPRMAIVGEAMTLEEFAADLSRLPLDAELLAPPAGWAEDPRLAEIRIRIPGIDAWGTGEVNLFLSERGRLDPVVEKAAGTVTVAGPLEIARPLNRIIVSARDRATGRYRLRSWILLRP